MNGQYNDKKLMNVKLSKCLVICLLLTYLFIMSIETNRNGNERKALTPSILYLTRLIKKHTFLRKICTFSFYVPLASVKVR